MAKIIKPNFENTAFGLTPYVSSPDLTDVIQQSLSRLVGWDSAAETWRFVRINEQGDLFATIGPEQATSFTVGFFTVTGTAQQIVASNTARKKVIFYNNGASTVYIGPDNAVTISTGLPILAGGVYEEDVFNGPYWAVTSGASINIRILEYT